MIVRPAGSSLHLITQPDHAQVAARIIAQAGALDGRPRRDDILFAVAEHDNGWKEEDEAPILNPATGRVADFVNVPLAVRHRVWPRAIRRLEHRPWAAALVAHHAVVVYDRFRAENGWTPFFEGMETARDRMLRASGRPIGELLGDYEFVRLADLISLVFCMGATPPQHFHQWTVQLQASHIVVTPDLFGGRDLSIDIQARVLPDEPFSSDVELRTAVGTAPVVTVVGEVSGTP